MEILKKSLIVLYFFSSLTLFSQTSKEIQSAFTKSYASETEYKYNEAIIAIKPVYNEKNYENNLRLGWLNYLAEKYTASSQYYNISINLTPYSLEARFGYILPQAALNNWETVKKQYLEILKIDPKNTTANYRLGYIHYYNKEYSTALKYFEICANLYTFEYDSILM